MTDDDRQSLGEKLLRLWPRKFTDPELIDWGNRLDRYRLRDVLQVLDEHKNQSKFAPKVSEILHRLKGREKEAPATVAPRHDSLVEALRKQAGGLEQLHDWEVLLRYWHELWWQYKRDADGRARMRDGGLKRIALMTHLTGEEQLELRRKFIARAEVVQQLHAAQEEGMRRKVEAGCVGGLTSAGMTLDDARKSAVVCFWTPREFPQGLSDVLMNASAVEAEPVEVA